MRNLTFLALALLGCGDSGGADDSSSAHTSDADADGFGSADDCDDNNANVFPGAEDAVGDGVDNNCDGIDGVDFDQDGQASFDSGGLDCDDTDATSLGEDADNDGSASCVDCLDTNPDVFPGAVETCDDVDTDCSGQPYVNIDGVGVCSQTTIVDEPVDVLMIIDDSCSMAEEQAALAIAATEIIDVYQSRTIDFHIGVVTTDMNRSSMSGNLASVAGVRWLDPSTPNLEANAATIVTAGTGGSADERGRDAAYGALTTLSLPGAPNDGFLRDDAHLDIIALSDEEDHSTAVSLPGFTTWLTTLKTDGYQAYFHSIVSPTPVCPEAVEPGEDYIALTDATGGLFTPICDATGYASLLNDVADIHPREGETRFGLPEAADPNTLAADELIEGAVLNHYDATQLTYDAITMEVILPIGVSGHSEVVIWYAPAP